MSAKSKSEVAAWQYNEFKQVGKDYGTESEVEAYDSSHADFRDIERESREVLEALGVEESDRLIDLGSGTGTFAIEAARRCAGVWAVDVSEAMIRRAEAKAEGAGVSNIEFCHGGFLTHEHGGEPVDVITTTFALHHLPDFWKGIALRRMSDMLKPGGQLYICDLVIDEMDAVENIGEFIEEQAAAGGDFLREDAEGHFREEFSTYDWVMDGLLERAGFAIDRKCIESGVIGTYFCTRNAGALAGAD